MTSEGARKASCFKCHQNHLRSQSVDRQNLNRVPRDERQNQLNGRTARGEHAPGRKQTGLLPPRDVRERASRLHFDDRQYAARIAREQIDLYVHDFKIATHDAPAAPLESAGRLKFDPLTANRPR